MNNWDARDEGNGKYCTADADLHSVKSTCEALRMPLHLVNFAKDYWMNVFQGVLVDGYRSGIKTPNPDVICNREIKFGKLFEWAQQNGFDRLATGHYARIVDGKLLQAVDIGKDQTYFLSQINRDLLPKVIFPLGQMMKSEVKRISKDLTFDWLNRRKESMGLCFVGKRRDFSEFLADYLPDPSSEGNFVCFESGEIIGKHDGLPFYTIGQNAKIPGMKCKYYVAKKDPESNEIYVVKSLDSPLLNSKAIRIGRVHWLVDEIPTELTCSIRSFDKIGAKVTRLSDDTVHLETPLFAPSPGQFAVFYQNSPNGRICTGSAEIIS